MKKKEKELTKKARKQIRQSLEELLTEEITKAIVAQGRNPKKAAKEIKKSVSLIAKTLAQKESLSKPAEEKGASEKPEIRESVKSFDVPPIPAPEIPLVTEAPVARVRKGRKTADMITAEAEATPVLPVRRGRKPSNPASAPAKATPPSALKRVGKADDQAASKVKASPARPIRKKTVIKPAVETSASTAVAESSTPEEVQRPSTPDQENTDI